MSTILTNIKKIFFGSSIKSVISSVLILAVVYIGLSFYVAKELPEKLFDNKVSWASVPAYGYNLEFITNKDKQNISLWEFSNPKSDEAMLYLHGNSGRINDFIPPLYFAAGNVYTIAYPGYSESEGSPTPDNVLESAQLAYNKIIEKGYPESKITILGHSMGGAPATYIASKNPNAKKLVLINTFSSVQSMCMRQLSILCVFTSRIFPTMDYAKDVIIPVRQFAYKNDLTVPFQEGEKLFESFVNVKNNDKKFIEMFKNTHTYPEWELIVKEIQVPQKQVQTPIETQDQKITAKPQ